MAHLLLNNLATCERVIYQPRIGEKKEITFTQHNNDMYYEAEEFAKLYQQRNVDHNGLAYSILSSTILTEIRKQTGVVFTADQH